MLTRKVYNQLAEIIRDIPDTRIRESVSIKMAGVLKEDNSRFNNAKWFPACGVYED